jgi:hypothetical protein
MTRAAWRRSDNDDYADEALEAIKQLTHDGQAYVLGCLTWDAPEAVLHAIDMAAAENQGYIKPEAVS